MTLALIVLAFFAGAWVALVIRALFAQSSDRRIREAAEASLTPEHLERLREHIAVIDEHERERVGGGALIHYPPARAHRPVAAPPKPDDALRSVVPPR